MLIRGYAGQFLLALSVVRLLVLVPVGPEQRLSNRFVNSLPRQLLHLVLFKLGVILSQLWIILLPFLKQPLKLILIDPLLLGTLAHLGLLYRIYQQLLFCFDLLLSCQQVGRR